jgi:cobalt-zinc-cadmium efflux system membrane fusion protein
MTENTRTTSTLELPPTRGQESETAGEEPRRSSFGWLAGRAIPNLLILLALGGLAYWGHHTGWKLPRFAEMTGAANEDKDDWCAEHAVPESLCVACNPDLMPRSKSYGWCRAHGIHECPLEHPDVAQLKYTPRVTQADLDRARRALEFADRPANSSKCKLHRRRIQFASEEAVVRAGVEVAAAWEAPIVEAISANGEITYDESRVASLATPLSGRVWRVFKEMGQPVQKGDVLVVVDAAEVGKAKAEYLQALAQVELRARNVGLLKPLENGPVAGTKVMEAEAALRESQVRLVAARQALGNFGLSVRDEDVKGLAPDEAAGRLQFLGLPQEVLKLLDAATTTANLVPVKSSLDGVVASRKVVAGEQVDASRVLIVVADTRQMWLTLQVRQEDARLLRARDDLTATPGQAVQFRPGGLDRMVVGEVVWVSTAADEKTRTVKVRANLANPDGQLRAYTFGSGRVILREERRAVVVPSEAVQWEGDCHVVFVRDKNFQDKDALKVFHTRTVRPGAKDGKLTEIIAGVLPGEMVVTTGSGLLRSELLKNNLGEG